MTDWMVWRASKKDATELARLEARAFQGRSWGRESVRDSFDAPGVRVQLAGMDRSAPLAFAIWRDLGGEGELLTIGVDPAAQRQGAARAMLSNILAAARSAGAKRMFLEVDSGNEAALTLYRRAGFEEAGLRRGYYRDGADALVMRLTL